MTLKIFINIKLKQTEDSLSPSNQILLEINKRLGLTSIS